MMSMGDSLPTWANKYNPDNTKNITACRFIYNTAGTRMQSYVFGTYGRSGGIASGKAAGAGFQRRNLALDIS